MEEKPFKDILAETKTLCDRLLQGGGADEKRFEEFLTAAAEALSRIFSLYPDEVSLLVTDKREELLYFGKPDYLRNAGILPMSSFDSLAVESLRTAKARVVNNMKKDRYSSIFEMVKNPIRPNQPIQKMLIIPAISHGKRLGVVELNRKGPTSSEAGPQFSEEDLRQALDFVREILPAWETLKPEGFRPKLTEAP